MHTVSVMGVDIHISDPFALAQEILDRQGRVVEHAEPRGVARGGVVQAA